MYIIKKISHKIDLLSSMLIGLMTLTIFLTALTRYFLPFSLPDGYDLSRHMLGISIVWGLAIACNSSDHIKVDIVYSLIGSKYKYIFDILSEGLITIFIVAFCWKFFDNLIDTYNSNLVTGDLNLPIWPAYSLIWLGLIASVLMALFRIFKVLFYSKNNKDFYNV